MEELDIISQVINDQMPNITQMRRAISGFVKEWPHPAVKFLSKTMEVLESSKNRVESMKKRAKDAQDPVRITDSEASSAHKPAKASQCEKLITLKVRAKPGTPDLRLLTYSSKLGLTICKLKHHSTRDMLYPFSP